MTYNQWLAEWLENYVKPVSKQKTYVRYTEIVRQHILKQIGGYEIETLTPLVIQQYIMRLLKSGNLKTGGALAPNSVNSVVTVLQNSLKSAYAVGQIKENIAGKIVRPRTVEKRLQVLPLQSRKKLKKKCLPRTSPVCSV